jgi:hypothetical protein
VQEDLGEKIVNEHGKGNTNARRKQHQHENNNVKIAKKK